MTLQELMEHSFWLYGRRLRIYLPGLRERLEGLSLSFGDLSDAIRKNNSDAPNRIIGVALARVLSRVFCLAEHFKSATHELPLVEALARKYPTGYCAYCLQLPCQCPEPRPAVHMEDTLSREQLRWSLREWCLHFERLYGAKNRERGIWNVLNRLYREVAEILSLSVRITAATSQEFRSVDAIYDEFALEFADTLAWIIAVANVLEVDIEQAFLDRYGNGCRKCGQNPCACLHFSMKPVEWLATNR